MRLAVVGDPVAHSRSPAIHTAALAATGIDGAYEARRVGAADLAGVFAELRAGMLDGANVTMPHKAAAAASADAPDALVAATGVANTLRRRKGEPLVEATNTDVGGLAAAAAAAGIPTDAPILVLGGGGSARAALAAFSDRPLRCSVRNPEAALPAALVPWGEGWPGAVVVNATPLGMAGEALPDAILTSAVGLIDLPYGARPTPAVETARVLGIPVADGISVLVAQAALSFTWWTGVAAPLDAMRNAARSV